MNHLLHLIANYRFESNDDLSPMALVAEREFNLQTFPLLQKAFPDGDDLDQVVFGIGGYLAAVETASYLDGMRDIIGLLCFHGTRDEALSK